MSKKSVGDFLNSFYKEYAYYTIENRAIPHIIDGFKPVQRKIFYTALEYAKSAYLKTASLSGFTIGTTNYHHGDSSVNGAITLLSQSFTGANNIPMFDGEGNFGNRFIPEAAAARYTKVKLNKQYLNYFTDFEVMDNNGDPDNPEPLTYLPLIPMVLVNGVDGIAIGFATSILPRNPDTLKLIIKHKLSGNFKGHVQKSYEPYFKGFEGKIEWLSDQNCWLMTGICKKKDNVVEVTELPINFTREKYTAYLIKLQDRGKIRNFVDKSKEKFHFVINLPKNSNLSDEQLITEFRLQTTLTENLTVIDTNGKLHKFNNPDELVDEFIKYRLKKVEERLSRLLDIAISELKFVKEKAFVIKLIQDGIINISNLTKEKLKDILKKKNIQNIDRIVSCPFYDFTTDSYSNLKIKHSDLQKEIDKLTKSDHIKIYMEDLKK